MLAACFGHVQEVLDAFGHLGTAFGQNMFRKIVDDRRRSSTSVHSVSSWVSSPTKLQYTTSVHAIVPTKLEKIKYILSCYRLPPIMQFVFPFLPEAEILYPLGMCPSLGSETTSATTLGNNKRPWAKEKPTHRCKAKV